MMKKTVIALVFLLIPCIAYALPCDVSISISSNKETFDNGEKIEFYSRLNDESHYYVIEYWIEDLHGNIIKRKRNTTNQAKKVFTPKNISTDIIIKSRTSYLDCDDVNNENNLAEKRILFANPQGNSTYKEIGISFEITNSDKLERFASGLYNPKTTPNRGRNTKIVRLIPYFLVVLAVLISIVLIWRR